LRGHREVVRQLLAAGADVNVKDEKGATALILASVQGHREIAEMLRKAGAK